MAGCSHDPHRAAQFLGVSTLPGVFAGLDLRHIWDQKRPMAELVAHGKRIGARDLRGGALALLAWGAVSAAAAPAHADIAESADYADYPAPEPERRYGFTFGLDYGLGFGSVQGYPNKLTEIGDPGFEQNVSGVGGIATLWLGGALRDWFTFAVGLSSHSAVEGKEVAGGGSLVFRVEGFPLYSLGGGFRDLGVAGDFGAGAASVLDEEQEVVADSGLMSSVGFSAFYEPWQFWHFSAGPVVRYGYDFSQSWSAHTATAGLRLVFYGVQP
jgi:hypothetical protein